MNGYKRQTTGDVIYQEIKRRIIELEIEPNEHLSEETLAKNLEVSRTPLRQALIQLEMEHMVTKQKNGRMYAAPITIEEAKEIFLVREVLEGLVAREATLNMNPALLQQLEDKMRLMKLAAEQMRNADTIRYGSEFHALLYQPSQNPTAIRFLEQLRNRIERYRRIGGYKHPHYTALLPVEEHQQIFELIRQGDAYGVLLCSLIMSGLITVYWIW